MKTPRIGQLRERVEIQTLTRTPGLGGESAITWPTLATVWARVKPMSGNENIDAGQMASPFTHEVTIRHRSDVGAQTHRIIWRTREFNILSQANLDERREYLTLRCEEGVLT